MIVNVSRRMVLIDKLSLREILNFVWVTAHFTFLLNSITAHFTNFATVLVTRTNVSIYTKVYVGYYEKH